MKNVTAKIKGLYEVDEILLAEVKLCIIDYATDYGKPIVIYACKKDAIELKQIANGEELTIALQPEYIVVLKIKLDEGKECKIISVH